LVCPTHIRHFKLLLLFGPCLFHHHKCDRKKTVFYNPTNKKWVAYVPKLPCGKWNKKCTNTIVRTSTLRKTPVFQIRIGQCLANVTCKKNKFLKTAAFFCRQTVPATNCRLKNTSIIIIFREQNFRVKARKMGSTSCSIS
jgi:hypothetical protein